MATSILTSASFDRRTNRLRAPETHVDAGIAPASYFRWKRVVDLTAAVVLLIPVLPVLGLLVLLVRLTSRGPGIYAQVRVGRNGRTFTMYKIRSMRQDAESRTGAVWAKERDPRVTFVGRILRKLHLDELPQLFNILKGEMSLVGPRPERPEFVQVLERSIPGYCKRLAVAPGITGLAQVNLPPDTDLESVRRKLILDLEYVLHASLWMDLRLALCTAARMTKLSGPILLRLFGIYRETLDVELASKRKHTLRPAYQPIPLFVSSDPYGYGFPVPVIVPHAEGARSEM